MSDKTSFYRSEGGAFVTESETSTNRYNGMERRRDMRRKYDDRRDDVRFDLNGDRRQNHGRRNVDHTPTFF